MKTRMKSRVFSLLMVAAMILTLLPVTALAADYDGHWAANYIEDARERSWMNGYPDGTFRPDASITRAEFASMLWRALGESAPEGESPFADVAAGDWYHDAVTALYEAGIASGYSNGTYGPNDTMTREVGFVMLARAFGLAPEDSGAYTAFGDSADVSDWARDSASALIERGYVTGDSNQLMPQKNLTRGEMAKLLIIVFDGEQKPDDTAPVITLTQSPTTSTYGKVTVTVTAEDESGIGYIGWRSSTSGASYTDKTGFTNITDAGKFTVSSNGWYAVCATDTLGNFSYELIQISNIKTSGGSSTVSVTGVSLDKTSVTLTQGGTETLTATVTPANATNKNVTWSSSDSSVATVDSTGLVTAVTSGSALITVTTASGGYTATCDVTVNDRVNAETPVITAQPADVGYILDDTAAPLTVTAGVSDGGTISYEWYSNTVNDNTSGSALGVTTDSYTPPTGAAGTTYYYVVVTNTITDNGDGGAKTASVTSAVAAVTVTMPTYTIAHNVEGSSYTFPSVTYGYSQSDLQPFVVTITNTGTGTLTDCTINTGGYFEVSPSTLGAIAPGATATFTVTPKTGLSATVYIAIVTITGTPGGQASFSVNLIVDV